MAPHPEQAESLQRPILYLDFRGLQSITHAQVAALGIAALGVDQPVLDAHVSARYSSSLATGVVSLVSGTLS